jgi:hypothetical protein
MGYVPGGPKPFIAEIEKIRAVLSGNPPPAIASSVAPTAASPASENAPTAKPVESLQPRPEARYEQLTLKGVTGSDKRRLALINNVTFSPGEEAMVKLKDGRVKVRCLEISEKSVIVAVDGTPEKQELQLSKP